MLTPKSWAVHGTQALLTALACTASLFSAQDPPPASIRQPELRRDALIGVDIIPFPGTRLENGVILLRDGVIEAVGTDIDVPAGYRIHDRTGLVAYPGLIEPALLMETTEQATALADTRGAHHNRNVVPQLDVSEIDLSIDESSAQLRQQGFCTALVLPQAKLFRGIGQVVLLGEEERTQRSPGGIQPLSLGLDTSGGWRSRVYPGSSMGVVALLRQVFSDAHWHNQCQEVWANHPSGNEPPLESPALDSLAVVINGDQPVFIDATSEIRALRGARLAEEFDLNAVIVGSGMEFRRVDEVAATGLPVLVPVAYPKKPEATSARAAEDISLRTLLTWKHAPENARRLHEAGCDIAFTTHRLSSRSEFRKNLADAIARGLPEDVALEAVTKTPARLLGVEETLGTIEPGRIGNIVIVDGDLFDPQDSIREVWVAGRRHSITEEKTFDFPEQGTLIVGDLNRNVTVDRAKNTFKISVNEETPEDSPEPQPEAPKAPNAKGAKEETAKQKPTVWQARSVQFSDDRVSGVIEGEAFGSEGPVRFDAVLLGDAMIGVGETSDGKTIRFELIANESDRLAEKEDETESSTDAQDGEELVDASKDMAPLPVPLGAFGRVEAPQQETVFFDNATIWTAADDGILEEADLLIADGVIVEVGQNLTAPDGARIVDASGMHITPGLIDCHSHTGIDGSVNEGSQNNTAEVRIGDVLDPDDVNWYRQLAGGLTTANQLHGSANPIGGQNAVVKLRWGTPTARMHFEEAMPGIKFALGENVVRPENRYPDTRMGVAAFLEDAFRAASEYEAQHAQFAELETNTGTMPPRRNLELEAVLEILNGERLVHCHSYRQDEILMLLRTAERWGFTIGTLQHVLEGYKIAEAIAAHGAGASSFSDWWAYKMEVMDAVPHNGTLMTNVGVLTSFNSDSDELARRMNVEAAKAVRYGGLSPHDALKMVTINPARQLRIHEHTGSIETGKDADLALWNGDPLSTFTRCQQTWIDGARYFDIEEDQVLTQQARTQRAELLAELVARNQPAKSEESAPAVRGRGQWRGPPGGRRRPVADSGRNTLIARMLDNREDFLVEMVRSGLDPEEMRPGSCGCDEGTATIELLRQEAGR